MFPMKTSTIIASGILLRIFSDSTLLVYHPRYEDALSFLPAYRCRVRLGHNSYPSDGYIALPPSVSYQWWRPQQRVRLAIGELNNGSTDAANSTSYRH